MIQPTSIPIKLLWNHPLFVLLEEMYCTSALSALVTNRSLTLSSAARSLFVKSTPPFSAYTACSVSLTIFANVRFQNFAVVPDRRQDLVHLATTNIDIETQLRHVADRPDRCIQSFASFHPFREWNPVRFHRCLRLFVCVVGTWRFMHVNDRIHVPHPWSLNCILHLLTHWYPLHPPLDQEVHLCQLDSLLPRSTLDS